ncbi:GSCFA domain-containing protein [Leisingera sp. ANG-Vp]|uniref:GSCFA domain-containing protein n=1 Tax=Leisingera sp. ANG-Vp TaxID=1577896 RepID=UPI00057CC2B5|nr:GSCFA domain-containing protein [Leisingera sp. ANG-Vp]KIC18502.1 GSCFA family protein [Leisingera sp. ANG-Vp]
MNPYESVPPRGFWRTAVADKNMLDISGLWVPKFRVAQDSRVSTYGSCFAQHIGRALAARGFSWFRPEERPFGLSDDNAAKFNYDVFSSRTGNIYTATLLLQWLKWAFGGAKMPDEVWEKDGRWFDPFRPNVEPGGFASKDELLQARAVTLEAFRRSVAEADVFVFTLGLTEQWLNKAEGYEYPMCPGTVAGTFDPQVHQFNNLVFGGVQSALQDALKRMTTVNPGLKVIFTVSPVPLTATKSGKHVLVATMQSKSILRAVAGQMADRRSYVDYFPSYEIINSAPFKGAFFEPNQRNVAMPGVRFVMDTFFGSQAETFGVRGQPAGRAALNSQADLVCEEEILAKFGGQK